MRVPLAHSLQATRSPHEQRERRADEGRIRPWTYLAQDPGFATHRSCGGSWRDSHLAFRTMVSARRSASGSPPPHSV